MRKHIYIYSKQYDGYFKRVCRLTGKSLFDDIIVANEFTSEGEARELMASLEKYDGVAECEIVTVCG